MELKFNQSTIRDLEKHLMRCNRLFNPPLSSIVNIRAYSEKIKINGYTFEIWENSVLIGCIAFYKNNETKEVFITNVTVEEEFQSMGLAQKMLVELDTRIDFKSVKLEVNKNNKKAINLYIKNGFKFKETVKDKNILIKKR